METSNPIISLIEQNHNSINDLLNYKKDQKINNEKILEQNSKAQSQKLMRQIFELDNECLMQENDFNEQIRALKEELDTETENKNQVKIEYYTVKNESESMTILLQEEIKNRDQLIISIENSKTDLSKKLESMKLKHEQDKYIATNFTKNASKPKLKQPANNEHDNLAKSKHKSKEMKKLSIKK